MDERPTLSLAIPFFNEEDSVEPLVCSLLERFAAAAIEIELLAVDNGSTDATAPRLARLAQTHAAVRVVTVTPNRGYSYAVRTGLEHARGRYVGFLCGDGQVTADDALEVFGRLLRDDLPAAKGARRERPDGVHRVLTSKAYNALFRALFPLHVSDIGGQPKVMRREILERMQLDARGWAVDVEVLVKGHALGVMWTEVSTGYRPRSHGCSKIRPWTFLELTAQMLIYRLWRVPRWRATLATAAPAIQNEGLADRAVQ